MRKEIILKTENNLDLHDRTVSAIQLKDGELSVYFEGEKIICDGEETTSFVARFKLNPEFVDEEFCPAVRKIKSSRFFRHAKATTMTLREFIDFIERKGIKLSFYSKYYHNHSVLLFFMGDDWAEYGLDLWVDQITYEW